MKRKLKDAVSFEIDRLFNGAIDVDWLCDKSGRSEKAARAFVFHGPKTHGVTQGDVGVTSHRLVDTASFVKRIIDRVETQSGNAFTLAIAGFGSGKSHLAVTISELLSTTDRAVRNDILSHIAEADSEIGESVLGSCRNIGRTLVLTFNGMNNGDLSSGLLAQLKDVLSRDGLDLSKLENLRKRFAHAANLIRSLDEQLMPDLFAQCGVDGKNAIALSLESFDESTYKKVHGFLSKIGINLSAVRDETAKDIINLVVREFVGKDKPYSHLLILFDEFGHYMEFATSHPQIAGDGALQHLFEGVQGNEECVTFVGFVQYELKSYAQRLPSEFKNEMNRFITRFDNAEKLYLSSNLETLVASLLKKSLVSEVEEEDAENLRESIMRWYPVAGNYSTWADKTVFRRVIAVGCWPLSPLAMWVLFYLSSSGRYLQQRSALTLLKAALDTNSERELESTLPPVSLWTSELQQEFEGIEESSAAGTLFQSYNAVCQKFDSHLSSQEKDVLKGIILLNQTQLKAETRDDADYALMCFAGLQQSDYSEAIRKLQEDYNVIEWDAASRSYELLSDNASRPQFLHLLRQRAQEYDETRKAEIFCGIAPMLPDLTPPECAFANHHLISTPEWSFLSKPTYWARLKMTIGAVVAELDRMCETLVPEREKNYRGLMIPCYVPSSEDIEAISDEGRRLLVRAAKKRPVLVVFIQDDPLHTLTKAMVEMDILDRLSAEEKGRFGQLIAPHRQRQQRIVSEEIHRAVMARQYVTPFQKVTPTRLPLMESALFEVAYPNVLSFPFDGFATSRGNAAKDCTELTKRLVGSTLTFGDTQAMDVQQRNRAQSVLNRQWKVFAKSDGTVVQKPGDPVARAIFAEWEEQMSLADGLNCAQAIKFACAAPFGANVASAGLLLGVFMQAFQKVVQLQYEGRPVSTQVVAESMFTGGRLDIDYLGLISVYRVTGENGAWDQLIADWTACSTYRERAEFVEKFDELESASPLPGVLRPQVSIYRREAKDAADKIEAADGKESDYIEKIENGTRAGKASLVAYGASLLQSHARDLSKDSLWDPIRDIAPMVKRVNEAKITIAQLFDGWLARSQPRGSSQQDLMEFRRDCEDRMGRNLKNLDMSAEREKLTRHVERVARSFEYIITAQKAISDFDSWQASFGIVSEQTAVARLAEMDSECAKWGELLKKSLSAMKRLSNKYYEDELTKRLQQADVLQKSVKDSRKAIDKRAAAIWKKQLTAATASEIGDEVDDLLRLYQGVESSNLDDFRIIRNVVTAFRDIEARLDSMQTTQAMFDLLAEESRKEFISRFEEDEPPWPLDETFDKLLNEIYAKRRKASSDWMASMKEKASSIEAMSMQDAEALMRELSDSPPYFDQKDSKDKEILLRKLEKQLESRGVEWLYERYKQLSSTAQKRFKELIKTRDA